MRIAEFGMRNDSRQQARRLKAYAMGDAMGDVVAFVNLDNPEIAGEALRWTIATREGCCCPD
jgi:hypothetical protein